MHTFWATGKTTREMAKVPFILRMVIDMSGDLHQPLTSVLSMDEAEM